MAHSKYDVYDQVNSEDYDVGVYWLNEDTGQWEQLNKIDVNWEEDTLSVHEDKLPRLVQIGVQDID